MMAVEPELQVVQLVSDSLLLAALRMEAVRLVEESRAAGFSTLLLHKTCGGIAGCWERIIAAPDWMSLEE